jgi:hypothetical protein
VLIDRDEAWPALTAKIHDRISDLRRDLLALYNCIAELAACGLVLAKIRTRGRTPTPASISTPWRGSGWSTPNPRAGFNGCGSRGACWHTSTRPPRTSKCARPPRIITNEFIPFYDAYRAWIGRCFSATPPA